ncbi:MAG: hypothetical protein K6T26_08200, partial [Alicyclobacillus sp.]|nr:hypothetical protein [Alicyclobacillus sp.]
MAVGKCCQELLWPGDWLIIAAVRREGEANMRVRVSAVQYRLCTIASWGEFAVQVQQAVAAAAEFHPDFVLFPELFTTQLLSIGDGRGNALPFAQLPSFTQAYQDLFTRLARETGMYLIGGTHVVQRGDTLQNVAFLF